MKLDAMLFDLDGTLVDSSADITAAVNHVIAQRGGAPLSRAAVRNALCLGISAMAEWLGHSVSEIEAAMRECVAYYAQHALECTDTYPGIRAMLADLDEVPLAVVSNKPEALCRHILTGLGIADRFEVIVGCDTCAEEKPSPVPVRETLARLRVLPSRAAMVGDTPTDIFAANVAGVHSVGVTWGYASASELRFACANQLVESPSELAAWIGNHRGDLRAGSHAWFASLLT